MEIERLKLEIKKWEHSFKKNSGRAPTREDIKQNAEIALKYSQYKAYKNPKRPPQTPTKRKRTVLQTPQKTSPAAEVPDTPIYTKEIGPTPQLNGRVLSIFDVITSPKSTPTKQVSVVIEDFKTPTKKLDFSSIMDEEENSIENSIDEPFKTPVKPISVAKIQETPAYLRVGQTSQVITASPSPLASQRIRKGLSTIIHELHDIQDELKYGDFDEEEYIPQISSDEELEDDNKDAEGEHIPVYKKKKTQKRQTRRVKMKARPVTEKDEMANKDLKAELQKLETIKEDTQDDIDDGSEEWSEEEETFVAQPLDPTKKYKAYESRNFKRLKINKKKGGFFGKRSRGR